MCKYTKLSGNETRFLKFLSSFAQIVQRQRKVAASRWRAKADVIHICSLRNIWGTLQLLCVLSWWRHKRKWSCAQLEVSQLPQSGFNGLLCGWTESTGLIDHAQWSPNHGFQLCWANQLWCTFKHHRKALPEHSDKLMPHNKTQTLSKRMFVSRLGGFHTKHWISCGIVLKNNLNSSSMKSPVQKVTQLTGQMLSCLTETGLFCLFLSRPAIGFWFHFPSASWPCRSRVIWGPLKEYPSLTINRDSRFTCGAAFGNALSCNSFDSSFLMELQIHVLWCWSQCPRSFVPSGTPTSIDGFRRVRILFLACHGRLSQEKTSFFLAHLFFFLVPSHHPHMSRTNAWSPGCICRSGQTSWPLLCLRSGAAAQSGPGVMEVKAAVTRRNWAWSSSHDSQFFSSQLELGSAGSSRRQRKHKLYFEVSLPVCSQFSVWKLMARNFFLQSTKQDHEPSIVLRSGVKYQKSEHQTDQPTRARKEGIFTETLKHSKQLKMPAKLSLRLLFLRWHLVTKKGTELLELLSITWGAQVLLILCISADSGERASDWCEVLHHWCDQFHPRLTKLPVISRWNMARISHRNGTSCFCCEKPEHCANDSLCLTTGRISRLHRITEDKNWGKRSTIDFYQDLDWIIFTHASTLRCLFKVFWVPCSRVTGQRSSLLDIDDFICSFGFHLNKQSAIGAYSFVRHRHRKPSAGAFHTSLREEGREEWRENATVIDGITCTGVRVGIRLDGSNHLSVAQRFTPALPVFVKTLLLTIREIGCGVQCKLRDLFAAVPLPAVPLNVLMFRAVYTLIASHVDGVGFNVDAFGSEHCAGFCSTQGKHWKMLYVDRCAIHKSEAIRNWRESSWKPTTTTRLRSLRLFQRNLGSRLALLVSFLTMPFGEQHVVCVLGSPSELQLKTKKGTTSKVLSASLWQWGLQVL